MSYDSDGQVGRAFKPSLRGDGFFALAFSLAPSLAVINARGDREEDGRCCCGQRPLLDKGSAGSGRRRRRGEREKSAAPDFFFFYFFFKVLLLLKLVSIFYFCFASSASFVYRDVWCRLDDLEG